MGKSQKYKEYHHISAPISTKDQWVSICKTAGLSSIDAITKIISELYGNHINIADFSMLSNVELKKIRDDIAVIKTHQTKEENRTIAVIRNMEKLLILPTYHIVYEIGKEMGADKVEGIIDRAKSIADKSKGKDDPKEGREKLLVDTQHENELLKNKLRQTYSDMMVLYDHLKWIIQNSDKTFFNGKESTIIKGSTANLDNIKNSLNRISTENPL